MHPGGRQVPAQFAGGHIACIARGLIDRIGSDSAGPAEGELFGRVQVFTGQLPGKGKMQVQAVVHPLDPVEVQVGFIIMSGGVSAAVIVNRIRRIHVELSQQEGQAKAVVAPAPQIIPAVTAEAEFPNVG